MAQRKREKKKREGCEKTIGEAEKDEKGRRRTLHPRRRSERGKIIESERKKANEGKERN